MNSPPKRGVASIVPLLKMPIATAEKLSAAATNASTTAVF